MVLASVMTAVYILFLEFYFHGHSPLISAPKMAENPKILLKMVAQGLKNTIKVKLTNIQCGLGICKDHYMHFIFCISFLWT